MKRFFHPQALAALMLGVAVAGSLTSCKKDPNAENNPPVVSIAGTPFTLSAEETRGDTQYVFPWTVSKTGVTDSVKEELDEMTVTSFNTITFTAKPDGGGDFPGVNVRSSNVGAVQVSMKGNTQFSLKYIGDGESTITVWNGNEGGNTTVTFNVQARKTIPVEGLLVRIDGKEYTIKAVTAPTWQELYQAMRDNPFYTVPYLSDEKVQHIYGVSWYSFYTKEEVNPLKVEILHLVPENTTYRRLNFSEANSSEISEMFCPGEYKWFSEARDGNSYKIPNGTDASILYGRSIFTGSNPGSQPGTNTKTACPPGSFYLFQFKASENQDNYTGAYALANTIKTGPAE